MRRLIFVLLLVASSAHADGRIGALGGARTNMGTLGNRYALGFLVGLEAQLMSDWLGLVWSMQYSRFLSSDARNTESYLELWDLDFGVRGRLALKPDGPAYFFGQLGVDILRASVPLEPDLESSYIGPTARIGGELVLGTVVLALSADYGLLFGGPSGLRLMLFAGLGG